MRLSHHPFFTFAMALIALATAPTNAEDTSRAIAYRSRPPSLRTASLKKRENIAPYTPTPTPPHKGEGIAEAAASR